MRRIKPWEVVRAYRRKGLRPIVGKYYGGGNKCCPMSAFFLTKKRILSADSGFYKDVMDNCKLRGYSYDYVVGIIRGVDGSECPTPNEGAEMIEGYYDGRAIRKSLKRVIK